jgi:hypothetical protein
VHAQKYMPEVHCCWLPIQCSRAGRYQVRFLQASACTEVHATCELLLTPLSVLDFN